jgi:hypothetical protein
MLFNESIISFQNGIFFRFFHFANFFPQTTVIELKLMQYSGRYNSKLNHDCFKKLAKKCSISIQLHLGHSKESTCPQSKTSKTGMAAMTLQTHVSQKKSNVIARTEWRSRNPGDDLQRRSHNREVAQCHKVKVMPHKFKPKHCPETSVIFYPKSVFASPNLFFFSLIYSPLQNCIRHKNQTH